MKLLLDENLPRFYFGRVCEVAIIGFGQCALDFPDLPFVQGDVLANGFCGQKRSTPVGRCGQGVQASLGVFFQADGHCGGHGVFLLCLHVYKLAHDGSSNRHRRLRRLPRPRGSIRRARGAA